MKNLPVYFTWSLGCLVTSQLGLAAISTNEFVSAEIRSDSIHRAAVWTATNPSKMDILNGPSLDEQIPFHSRSVHCTYDPSKQFGGSTPKFACTDDKTGVLYKVKYAPHSGEVHSEILGTRLFWALGFFADTQYATDVFCTGCPELPGYGGPAEPGTREFPVSTIEFKQNGKDIEVSKGSGWDFSELKLIDSRSGGATQEQVDALKLLNAFVQHWDSKADNQRLSCAKGKSKTDANGNYYCSQPFMMVHDLGESFGSSEYQTRADLESWKSVKIWKSNDECVAEISNSTGDLESQSLEISEAGRVFLLKLLKKLSKDQIRDLFKTSLITEKPDNGDIEAWASAFEEKITIIENHKCK